jgi:hypothetical protein
MVSKLWLLEENAWSVHLEVRRRMLHTWTVSWGNLFIAVKHIRFINPIMHATCFSHPQLPSGIKIHNLKSKGTYVKRVLRFVRSQIFYNCYTYLIACILTYLLTHSMEQSPSWEANWFSFLTSIFVLLLKPCHITSDC